MIDATGKHSARRPIAITGGSLFASYDPPVVSLDEQVDAISRQFLAWHQKRQDQLARLRAKKGLYCLVRGSGPTSVVLLHGLAMTSNFWKEGLLRHLHPDAMSAYTFYCPDLLGFGRSSDLPPNQRYSLDEQAATIITDVIQRFELHRIILAGHSFGGLLCIRVASMLPAGECRRIVTFSPAFFPTARNAELHIMGLGFPCWQSLAAPTIFGIVVRLINSFSSNPKLREWILGVIPTSEVPRESVFDFMATNHDAYRGTIDALVHQRKQMEPSFRSLNHRRIHILNLHGSADVVVPLENSISVAKRFPNFELHSMPNSPHHFPLSHARPLAALFEQHLLRCFSYGDCREYLLQPQQIRESDGRERGARLSRGADTPISHTREQIHMTMKSLGRDCVEMMTVI